MNSTSTTDEIREAAIRACRETLAEGLAEQREQERAAALARRRVAAEVDHARATAAGKVVDFLEFRARARWQRWDEK